MLAQPKVGEPLSVVGRRMSLSKRPTRRVVSPRKVEAPDALQRYLQRMEPLSLPEILEAQASENRYFLNQCNYLGFPPNVVELPETVILVINNHGALKPPILSPVNIARRISADLGTCGFSARDMRMKVYTEMQDAEIPGEELIAMLDDQIDHNPMRDPKKVPDFANNPEYQLFLKNKHYTKTKLVLKDNPIYNKKYETGLTQFDFRGIFIHGVDPEDKVAIALEDTPRFFYLSWVLQLLADLGVKNVYFYDLVCSKYAGVTGFNYFGGFTRRPRRRQTKGRSHLRK